MIEILVFLLRMCSKLYKVVLYNSYNFKFLFVFLSCPYVIIFKQLEIKDNQLQ